MNLVNLDQRDILKSLRASVSKEKEGLAMDLERMRLSLKKAEDKVGMQIDQVSSIP